jgi:translation initiation factor eIF-2B subunit delta
VLTTPVPLAGTTEKGGKGDKKGKDDADQGESITKQGLEGWRDQKDLYLLNLMYDITPAEYLDMVISELGSLPPSAVPVVNGVHGGEE